LCCSMCIDYLTIRHIEAIGCDSRLLTVYYLQDQDRLDG
jgi:hypothetical protein